MPEISGPNAVGAAELRDACLASLDAVTAAAPEITYIVGSGPMSKRHSSNAVADFRPWGIDVVAALPGGGDDAAGTATAESLPLSLAVGSWLLSRAGWTGDVEALSVGPDDDAASQLGTDLALGAERVALLVMSDGSARRSDDGPRPVHQRAAEFDADVVSALASGDAGSLKVLDADLAADVDAEGLRPLQVMAGAADETTFDTRILYDAAPFGVGYWVAVWERHG